MSSVSSHLIFWANQERLGNRPQSSTSQPSDSPFPPPWEQPAPAHWLLCVPRASPAPTSLIPGPLTAKQPREAVCICTTDLLVLQLTRMASAVNNLLLRDKQQNQWSRDWSTIYLVVTGRFTCLCSVFFSLTCLPAVLYMSGHVHFPHCSHVPLYLFFTCMLPLYTPFLQYNHVWQASDNLVLYMLQLA